MAARKLLLSFDGIQETRNDARHNNVLDSRRRICHLRATAEDLVRHCVTRAIQVNSHK